MVVGDSFTIHRHERTIHNLMWERKLRSMLAGTNTIVKDLPKEELFLVMCEDKEVITVSKDSYIWEQIKKESMEWL